MMLTTFGCHFNLVRGQTSNALVEREGNPSAWFLTQHLIDVIVD